MSNKLTFQKLMENLFLIQSSDDQNIKMSHYLGSILRKHHIPYHIDNAGNIIATKGSLGPEEYFPTIVAHYDTVHDIVSDYKVTKTKTKKGKTLYTSPTGIGGDDKVGLAIGLWLAITKPRMKLVFTVGEESGCIGASALDPETFANSGYLIEPDRRGNKDLILQYMGSPTASEGFSKLALEAASSHGYTEESGLITDVFTIQENDVELSAMNLSVGYYEPHSSKEYVILEDALTALNIVKAIINRAGFHRYEHVRPSAFVSKFSTGLHGHALGYINRSKQTSYANRFYSGRDWDTDDFYSGWGWTDDDSKALDELSAHKSLQAEYDAWLSFVIEDCGVNDPEYLESLGSYESFSAGETPEIFVDSIIPSILNTRTPKQ